MIYDEATSSPELRRVMDSSKSAGGPKGVGAQRVKGSRYIAETFKGYGVTHVFFVDAILRRSLVEMEGLGIKRVLTHSEKTAAYMADGYARVSGKTGVCMSQSVGAANLAAGLQDAFLGLSPVLAVTGRKAPLLQYRHAYQEILHNRMFDPVTKYNVFVERPEQLPFLMRQAFREATSGAPRPVHIDVMGHVGQDTDTSEIDAGSLLAEERFATAPALRVEPAREAVQEAVSLLQSAEKPVIIAGGGAVRSGAGKEVAELAETLSIPVAVTLNGKTIIPDDHPLNLGVVGSYARWCANKTVSQADLVLLVGNRASDIDTNDYTVPRIGTPLIQIDINPEELGRSYPNAVSLHGDARVTLRRMIESVRSRPDRAGWLRQAADALKGWRREFDPLQGSDAVPIRPERLCREISTLLPADAVLVADTGYSSIWTGIMVDLSHRGQSYLKAAGSLGWGFPAALGAKCAAPERPVVCFTGDGGFWYHLSELETAARCGINTVTVVNNNHILGQCEVGVNSAYGEREGRRAEMYVFQETDFARIAEDMGCLGIRVENPQEIAGAIERALRAGRPAVVDVVTDGSCKAPWIPSYSY